MKFVFLSTRTFESWDWTNPDTQGIGGSETSAIEMARRLAELGHTVWSFAPTGWASQVGPAGVVWFDIGALAEYAKEQQTFAGFCPEWDEKTVYVIYRAPELIDFLPDGALCWLICQDVDYTRKGQELTAERITKLTRLVALCDAQAEYFHAKYPGARVSLSSNGVKRALIEQIAADPPERQPNRLMYASSPDRGMEYLLQIFPRLRELAPDLELHIYYGFENIDKVVAYWGKGSEVDKNTTRLRALLEQPGVSYHGRMGQPELLREWFKSTLWVHPSNFTETSCITCMDAQACGAIPVTGPVWAIEQNVEYGVLIEGDVRHPLVQARYILEAFKLLADPERQQAIRADMMPWARETFDWENFAHQWQGWARFDIAALETAPALEAAEAVMA